MPKGKKKKSYYKGKDDLISQIKQSEKTKSEIFVRLPNDEIRIFNLSESPFSKFSSLLIDIPHSENGDYPRELSIPPEKLKKLLILFESLNIRDLLKPIITWCFMSMYFASLSASKAIFLSKWLKENHSECFDLLDFLQNLKENKKLIQSVQFKYVDDIQDNSPLSPQKKKITKSFKSPIAAIFIQAALQSFDKASSYDTNWYELFNLLKVRKENGNEYEPYLLKRRSDKANYYLFGLIYLLLKYHVKEENNPFSDNQPVVAEWPIIEEHEKKYSNRDLYLFVGKLLELSGLIELTKTKNKDKYYDVEDEEELIIDLIEKRMKKKPAIPLYPF